MMSMAKFHIIPEMTSHRLSIVPIVYVKSFREFVKFEMKISRCFFLRARARVKFRLGIIVRVKTIFVNSGILY